MKNNRRGFTLVELLVVISVIALLIAILMPSLKKARAQARAVKCGTNQRSVGIALFTYTTEFNEFHHAAWANKALRFRVTMGRRYILRPYTINPNGYADAGDSYWAAIYDPYLQKGVDPRLYKLPPGLGKMKSITAWEYTRCPDAKYTVVNFRTVGNTELPHDPYTLWSSLSFNGVTPGAQNYPHTATPTFFRYDENRGERVPTQISRIKGLGSIVMFQDGSEPMLDGNGDCVGQLEQWDEYHEWQREYFRHPQGNQATFADGHVESISREKSERAEKKLRSTYGKVTSVPLPWYSAL